MTYFIKMVLPNGAKVERSVGFQSLRDALDLSCTALAEHPSDLWIEDEKGDRVASMLTAILHCRDAADSPVGVSRARHVGRLKDRWRRAVARRR